MILNKIKICFKRILNNSEELLWAQIWRDTSKDIEWCQNISGISPGRWAVGYNYIYVMTRILNELEPKSVLELGLGVSTTLVSSYYRFQEQKEGKHVIIEHDSDWAEFYTNKHKLSPVSKVCVTECVKKEYKGHSYYAYKDMSPFIENEKFDVISIDGPWGEGKYSRRDILEFLPNILNDSFVIMIDDAGRKGEKQTIHDIERILENNNIPYCSSLYSGNTYVSIITSANNKYLCSL